MPLIHQLKKWERMSGGEASHYRGKSSLYKPGKAGCSGHRLPTVPRAPAQTRTHQPLLCTKTVRARSDSGEAAHVGVLPLLTSRYPVRGAAGSLKDLGLSQLRKEEKSFKIRDNYLESILCFQIPNSA